MGLHCVRWGIERWKDVVAVLRDSQPVQQGSGGEGLECSVVSWSPEEEQGGSALP